MLEKRIVTILELPFAISSRFCSWEICEQYASKQHGGITFTFLCFQFNIVITKNQNIISSVEGIKVILNADPCTDYLLNRPAYNIQTTFHSYKLRDKLL